MCQVYFQTIIYYILFKLWFSITNRWNFIDKNSWIIFKYRLEMTVTVPLSSCKQYGPSISNAAILHRMEDYFGIMGFFLNLLRLFCRPTPEILFERNFLQRFNYIGKMLCKICILYVCNYSSWCIFERWILGEIVDEKRLLTQGHGQVLSYCDIPNTLTSTIYIRTISSTAVKKCSP